MHGPRGLVVVGASAGGVEALRAFVLGLTAQFDAAVCVVLHIPRFGVSALPQILDRCGSLPARPASDGAAMLPGMIYVAPPDAHLLVDDGRMRLSRGPAENGHRPAIDPLFRSAARGWGAAAIGVVLSGSRDDGAAGLAAIARCGGAALVQDPAEALYPSMPEHAAERVPSARPVPAARLGPAVARLVRDLHGPAPAHLCGEARRAALRGRTAHETAMPADPTAGALSCPSCHGALHQPPDAGTRFRSRVGPAGPDEGTLDEQSGALEGALWMALRSLQEKAALGREMAQSATDRGSSAIAARHREMSREAEHAGRLIRGLIEQIDEFDGSSVLYGSAAHDGSGGVDGSAVLGEAR
ncbi:chemotaxis protein CheB [Dactylosporangium sp. NPDC049525]|uniref:chemotaxis protein CheB n=1 Tax=Dactylosporangium sp. NPDC049525 TaxID=3154730 RepID=UPI003430F951